MDRMSEITREIESLEKELKKLHDEKWELEKKNKAYYYIEHTYGDEYQYTDYILCGHTTFEEAKRIAGDEGKIIEIKDYQTYSLIGYINELYEAKKSIESYIDKKLKELKEKGIDIYVGWGHSFVIPNDDEE